MNKVFIVCALVLSGFCINSDAGAQFVDSVHSVTFGPNYSPGYGPDNIHFPLCIYGPPDSNARPNIASFGPENLLSLGTGGEIVLRFFNPIINGPGADFTVFENAFYVGDTNSVFAETGIVSVSKDGVNFVEFPYRVDTISINPLRVKYYGLAGITPTNSLASPFDPGSPSQGHSGGDSFDLDSIGVDTVYYVKITDAGDNVPDGGPAFDLDAVAVVNSTTSVLSHTSGNIPEGYRLEQNYPNPFNPVTTIKFSIPSKENISLRIYNSVGEEVSEILNEEAPAGEYEVKFDGSGFTSGVYFYRLAGVDIVMTEKMVLIK